MSLAPFAQVGPSQARPGKRALHLNLHPGQQAVWDSEARFTAAVAGTQSGKTVVGPAWLHREIQRKGPGDYGIVSATFDLFKMKVLPETLRFFCEYLDWGTYQKGDQVLTSHDGKTRLILRSAQSTGGLESGTWLAAWLDEAGQDDFVEGAWEAILRRLSLAQGRVLITTTPFNMGWLYVNVFCRWKGGDANYNVIQWDSTANPKFSRAEYERSKATLPDWKFEMFYRGQFVKPAGLIYQDYDEAVHLIRPFPIPDHWGRLVGVDFGAVNLGMVWLAQEMAEAAPGKTSKPTGRVVAYREGLRGESSGIEQALAALDYKEPVLQWLGGAKSEGNWREQWQQAGVGIQEPRITDLEAGIDQVIGLLRQRRLVLFDTLTGLRSEFGTYSREVDDAGNPTKRIKNKERFHRLDALRSACSAVPVQHIGEQPAVEIPADTRVEGGAAAWMGALHPPEPDDQFEVLA